MKVSLKWIATSILSALLVGCAATSPAPVSSIHKDYSSIERGSYRGSFYEVQKGDTLYFIAYVTDKNVKDLIRYNDLSAPYTIHPGQKIKLWRPAYKAPAYGRNSSGSASASASSAAGAGTISSGTVNASTSTVAKSTNKANANLTNTSSKNSNNGQKSQANKLDPAKSKEYVESPSKKNVNKNVIKPKPQYSKVSKWLWPTKGRIIKSFSAGDQGNKGIDIAGRRGQSVVSTASGTVVYSGNALRGYGNLIIVKHNDNYLSAYAHNDRLLVQEGQSVKAGQKIATMGSSGTSSVRLHFEIRYQGKSVNPKRYLP